MAWLDVEPCSGCWKDASTNLQYVSNLVSALKTAGFHVGIYSSLGSWAAVTGSESATTDVIKSTQLWYAHYDGAPNFDDSEFYHFAGFSKPNIKQYNDNGSACGLSYDKNWYP
mmetsp:Transcript_41650/g.37046  ORF Transcript_41650/g.37046 Transcript_41650/m.37046 type:complete len:113 (+) Transcript_41650:377-715(+)